jgi:hypothetical protein
MPSLWRAAVRPTDARRGLADASVDQTDAR